MNARAKLAEATDALQGIARHLAHSWSMRGSEIQSAECLMTVLAEMQGAIDYIAEAVEELPKDDEPRGGGEILELAPALASKARPS